MALFRKKADPISARSRELTAQISALEQEIRQLSTNISRGETKPSAPVIARPPAAVQASASGARDPVFEAADFKKAVSAPEPASTAAHYNDLGVRKYDLLGAVRKVRRLFSAAPTDNAKLVTYLAAGSVKGLKPLRYEKRIARNRFLFLSFVFALILWGLIAAFFNHR